MKMHCFHRLFAGPLLLAGALSFAGLMAQEKPRTDAKPPTPREVVARFVEAIGGREAVLKHSSTRLKGKWEMPAMGQSGEFELLRAKPNKQLMIIRVGDQMEVRQGFDGTVAWMTNPFGGPMVLNGKMLDQAREDADFYNTLREEQNYKSMETVGLGRFEGKEAVELKLVHKSGREVREYFDPKTGLLIGSKGTQESPQGANEVTLVFSDYKKLGSILEPTRITVKATGFEQSITTSGVEYDKLTDKDFALPEEIRALLKK